MRAHLTQITSAQSRSAIAAAGLAVCLVGLAGTSAGLVWVVAGVWVARSVSEVPVGAAWGLACLGAGLRWGTVGLGDVEVATRLFHPTVAAGGTWSRAGMTVALVAAVFDEAAADGLRSRAWAVRLASVAAIAALTGSFLVSGPADAFGAIAWVLAAVAVTAVTIAARPLASKIPSWTFVLATGAGVVAAVAHR